MYRTGPGAYAAVPADQRRMMLDNARTIAELRTKFPPFKAQIGRIACRTLVINGEKSALWLRRIGERTASSIPTPGARRYQEQGTFRTSSTHRVQRTGPDLPLRRTVSEIEQDDVPGTYPTLGCVDSNKGAFEIHRSEGLVFCLDVEGPPALAGRRNGSRSPRASPLRR